MAESQQALLKLFTDFEGGLPHHEGDWKFKYMKMESRYEEEKMACVYNIMEKNKLRKETEDLQTQLKKLETTKERLEENEVLKTRIQKVTNVSFNLLNSRLQDFIFFKTR